MSVAIECKINDQATPAVRGLAARLQPDRLAARVGPACAQLTRSYLRGLPANKKGWPTTNFWQRASRATTWTATNDGVMISINQIGVRQRYHGGPIKPVNAKFLTIPIAPQAYGKTASDFPGSFIIKTAKGAYLVQYGQTVSKTGKVGKAQARNASLEFLFKLSAGVNQKGNPNIIPSDDAYYTVIHQAIKDAVKP